MTARQLDELWTAHLGDLAFTLTAPPGWAEEQRRYLAGYLPGRVGDRGLGTFHLTVHPDTQCHQFVVQATPPPIIKPIEPVPGVVLLETDTPTGARCYTVAIDGVEQQAHAFAVRAQNQYIELSLHHTARKPHGYPLRLMREAMLRTYEDDGGTVFHAAGADLGGRGVMICGPGSAGKTTLLTCLLRSTYTALLANDRLILDHDRRLIAVPLPVPIARGTLDAVPELRNAVPTLSRPQCPVDELPRTFGTTQKVEFSAREYATALDVSLTPGSWLQKIIVPRLSDTAEPAHIRELSPEETQQVLRANCFTPHDEFWQQPWLIRRTTPDVDLHQRTQHLIHDLATDIPCYEIRFGIRNPLDQLDKTLVNWEENSR